MNPCAEVFRLYHIHFIMERCDIICSLPTSLACAVLRDWVNLKSAIKLNTAYCNKSYRETFLEVLQSDEYCVLEKIIIPRDINRLEEKYLGLCKLGERVRYIQILSEFLGEDAAIVARQFPNLMHVNLNALTTIAPELWTLIDSPHIKCLQLTYCQISDVASMFRALQINGHKICKLNFCMAELSLSTFPQIARFCPHLETLGLASTGIRDSIVTEIVTACPHIKILDLQRNDALTDEGILTVVRTLSALESLNIMELLEITDASLVHIYTHCADRLHTLHFSCEEDMEHNFSNKVVTQLLRRCTKLHTLSYSNFQLDSMYFLFEPASLANLTTLLLSGEVINDNNVIMIGQYAVNLQTLAIDSFCSCDAKAILSLCLGCPKLTTIYVDLERRSYEFEGRNTRALAEVAMLLWAKLKPGLQVHDYQERQLGYRVMDM